MPRSLVAQNVCIYASTRSVCGTAKSFCQTETVFTLSIPLRLATMSFQVGSV
ncbi:unnamed protein product [Hymenolepis diminuta]|uniref:Uncharacterized protein n=1 Tax=Hymenolepis diminuta TaxID=6216 RepID=A0A564ZEF0_HYMDI|nr:unnamed protein product [Hymenolepis diminuta]